MPSLERRDLGRTRAHHRRRRQTRWPGGRRRRSSGSPDRALLREAPRSPAQLTAGPRRGCGPRRARSRWRPAPADRVRLSRGLAVRRGRDRHLRLRDGEVLAPVGDVTVFTTPPSSPRATSGSWPPDDPRPRHRVRFVAEPRLWEIGGLDNGLLLWSARAFEALCADIPAAGPTWSSSPTSSARASSRLRRDAVATRG